MDSQKPKCRSKLSADPVRIHKYLAQCGYGSRRACERLVADGNVSVDGNVVRAQGVCVVPCSQIIEVNGRRVEPEEKVTLLLNKPRDVICTSSDPQGRRTFHSFLPRLRVRLFSVGRLDRDSEGLLLVTNDGELANLLTHPRHEVEKIYRVWLARLLTSEQMSRVRHGVNEDNDFFKVDDIRFVKNDAACFVYDVRLHEGRNRHIRKLFKGLGVGVVRLQRTALGSLKLGSLSRGAWRRLTNEELVMLRRDVMRRELSIAKK